MIKLSMNMCLPTQHKADLSSTHTNLSTSQADLSFYCLLLSSQADLSIPQGRLVGDHHHHLQLVTYNIVKQDRFCRIFAPEDDDEGRNPPIPYSGQCVRISSRGSCS